MKCQYCNNEEINKKRNICASCYAKDYRKKNKEKIKPVKQKQYLKRREYFLNQSKAWQKENKDKTNERSKRIYENNPELRLIRTKTRNEFNELKKNGECEKCGIKEELQFHHTKPYKYNKFQILCRECHMEVHGRLLVRTKKEYVIVSNEVKINDDLSEFDSVKVKYVKQEKKE